MARARAQDRDRHAAGRQSGLRQPPARRQAQRAAWADRVGGAFGHVAKSQPDGYLLTMLTGAFSAGAAVAKSLPYDPIRDFAFITLVSAYPMVVATAPNSLISSFTDLIVRAKAAPFQITYGMNLPGSVHHLTGELINVEAATSLRGIPYHLT